MGQLRFNLAKHFMPKPEVTGVKKFESKFISSN